MRPCASRIGAASAREFCFSDFAGSSPDGYSPQRAADGHGQFPCISGPRRARQRPRPRQLNSRAPRTPVPSDRAAAPCVSSAGHRTGASASRSAIADGRSRLDRRRPWRWPPPTPPRPGRPGCFLEALAALRDQGRPQRGDVVGEVLGHEPPKGPESSPRQRFDHGRRQPGRDRSRDPHARLPRKFDLAANTIIRTSAYQPIPPQLRKAAITGGLRFPSGAAQLHRVRERQSGRRRPEPGWLRGPIIEQSCEPARVRARSPIAVPGRCEWPPTARPSGLRSGQPRRSRPPWRGR